MLVFILKRLANAVLVMLAVGVTAFLGASHAAGTRPMLVASVPALALWLLVLAASLGVLRYHRHRLLALVLTGVVGLVVSLTFLSSRAAMAAAGASALNTTLPLCR